jgi:tungstate transport system permease protein
MDLLWQGFSDALKLLLDRDPVLLQICVRSLAVSLAAIAIASLIGIPAGVALAVGRFRGRRLLVLLTNTGMGLPPVLVGLAVSIVLWRTGPLGALRLIYTPWAMIVAQLIVALPIIAGLTRLAVESIDREQVDAFRVYCSVGVRLGRELVRAAASGVVLAVVAGFGRAIAEVGASLMVGGNIVGQTGVLTTAISLETSRGEFAAAIALGIVLLALTFAINVAFWWATHRTIERRMGLAG